jgi:hypothetical protein
MEGADLDSRKRKERDEAEFEPVANSERSNKKQKKSEKKNLDNYENTDEKDEGPQDPEYQEIQGDLFLCAEDAALAHCVSQGRVAIKYYKSCSNNILNADLRMGKGIAVDFKRKFGKVQDLMDQNKVVGEVALLKHKERFVYYLVTKERYWNKPTYQTLTSSLEKMRDHAVNNGVKMICMPKIGNSISFDMILPRSGCWLCTDMNFHRMWS